VSITLDHPETRNQPPRVPGALPVIGHGIPLLRRRLEFLQQAREQGPVVEIKLGPNPAYLVSDSQLLHQILVTEAAKFERGVHFQKARSVAGEGIITSSGSPHRQQRRLMLPAFNHKKVRIYADIMQKLAMARIESWPYDQPIALKPEFVSLATTIATKSLFSTDLAPVDVHLVERALPVLTRCVSMRALDPTGLLEKLPTPGNRHFNAIMADLDSLIYGIIALYRRNERSGNDLLSMLLLAEDAETGERMSDQQLRDEAVSILLSSAETTALTLSWACHELGRNPETQRKLQAEIDEILDGEPPGHDDLPKLDYTRRVIKETLRLYPPTYFLSRSALTDTELGGYRIPAGSTVLYSFYAQHRDPALFARPDCFDPDRWLPECADDVTPAAYIPFGEGAHRCLGEAFAWSEAMTTLAIIAGRRTLHPVPGRPVRAVGTVTLAPSNLRMIACRRTR
jgi:pentalenene oxygenase